MYVRESNRIFCVTYILSYCARETIVICQKTPRKKGILLRIKLLYSLCPITPQNKHSNEKNISFDRTLHQLLFVFSSLFCPQNYAHLFFSAFLLIYIFFPFVLSAFAMSRFRISSSSDFAGRPCPTCASIWSSQRAWDQMTLHDRPLDHMKYKIRENIVCHGWEWAWMRFIRSNIMRYHTISSNFKMILAL